MATSPADPTAGAPTPPPRTNPMRGRVTSRGDTPASAGNIANIVTVARILLAPVFVWLLLLDGGAHGIAQDGLWRWLAAALFVLAILTDSVDGFLARSRNLVTDQGKLLDPIADKVLVGGALVGLSILSELPWWVTIVILVREVGITVFRFAMLRDHVIPADILGKIKTVVQAVAISFALVPLGSVTGWHLFFDVLDTILMSAALILTVVSGASYLWAAWKSDRARRVAA